MQRDSNGRKVVERDFSERCQMHEAPNLSKDSGSPAALQLKSAGSNIETIKGSERPVRTECRVYREASLVRQVYLERCRYPHRRLHIEFD